jgi:hypothetical protein
MNTPGKMPFEVTCSFRTLPKLGTRHVSVCLPRGPRGNEREDSLVPIRLRELEASRHKKRLQKIDS